ncbi:hypothetical protein FMEAI12_4230006 [Parafrankia sp. Ea1.12]|nr:hypothetical protein FMEAI12_4230006 [Parafrankia sp. Ea1.12]
MLPRDVDAVRSIAAKNAADLLPDEVELPAKA